MPILYKNKSRALLCVLYVVWYTGLPWAGCNLLSLPVKAEIAAQPEDENPAAKPTMVEKINLKNRPAKELVPLLQPILLPDQQLSADGFTLILRADPKELRSLKYLIQELDKPQPRILISIHNKPYLPTTASRSLHKSEGSRQWTTANRDLSQTQTLAVEDGKEGSIQTALKIPQKKLVETPYGITEYYQHQTVTHTLHIRVQLEPDKIHVLLSIQAQAAYGGTPQQAVTQWKTELRVPLSEWIPIDATWDSDKGHWKWLFGPQSEEAHSGEARSYRTQREQATADESKQAWPIGLIRVDITE